MDVIFIPTPAAWFLPPSSSGTSKETGWEMVGWGTLELKARCYPWATPGEISGLPQPRWNPRHQYRKALQVTTNNKWSRPRAGVSILESPGGLKTATAWAHPQKFYQGGPLIVLVWKLCEVKPFSLQNHIQMRSAVINFSLPEAGNLGPQMESKVAQRCQPPMLVFYGHSSH